MLKSTIGVSPPRQSKNKVARESDTDRIQKHIQEFEEQLPKIRDEIFKLQIEYFQVTSPSKKVIKKPILQSIEKTNQEYELLIKKYDLSQNLVQTFKKILSIYPVNKAHFSDVLVKPKTQPLNSHMKEFMKQIGNFSKMTPLERTQKTQRIGASRLMLKKKLELYQNPQLVKKLIPLEEKEKRQRNDFIELLENDLKQLKAANQHLIRRFGTNSGFRISSQIKYGISVNESLKEDVKDFHKDIHRLKKEIRQFESQIESMKFPSQYERMISEGKKYKEYANNRITDLLNQASERVELGQKILIAIGKIATKIDPSHVTTGIALSELHWISDNMSRKLNKNFSFSTKSKNDYLWNLSTTLPKNDSEFPNVPELNFSPIKSFIPNTRYSRRALSTLNSIRAIENNSENAHQSIEILGNLLGNVLVDRFSPIFHKNNVFLKNLDDDIIQLPKPISDIVNLQSVFALYDNNVNNLFFTQFQPDEISHLQPELLQFYSEKVFLKERLNFSGFDFLSFFSKLIDNNSNIITCLWIIHDFAPIDTIPLLIKKIESIYETRKENFDYHDLGEVSAWAACFSSFLETKQKNIKKLTLNTFDMLFVKVLGILNPKNNNLPGDKCKLLALLRYAKFFPEEFIKFIDYSNNAASFIQNVIKYNRSFPTIITAVTEFVKTGIYLLQDDVLTWHTAFFYHLLICELIQKELHSKLIAPYLSIMCNIVESRNSTRTLQLRRLFFLLFLKKNFELEELFGSKSSSVTKKVTSEDLETPTTTDNDKSNSNEIMITPKHNTNNKINNQSDDDDKNSLNGVDIISVSSKGYEYYGSGYFEEEEEEIEFNYENEKEQPKESDNNILPIVPSLSLTPKGSNISKENIKINFRIGQKINNEESNKNSDDDSGPPSFVPTLSLTKFTPTTKKGISQNVSYHDLHEIGVFNADNPKLQLQFQQSGKVGPNRESVSIDDLDYARQRLMYPIYLNDQIHLLFIKMLFATLIEHSLHRLDVVFCDPFPFVNKKPNILFTLMQHMESTANCDMKNPLLNSIKLKKENDEVPPINFSSMLKNKDGNHYKEPKITRIYRSFKKNPLQNISTYGSSSARKQYMAVEAKPRAKIDVSDAKRLMRLTMPSMFSPSEYLNGKHVANGAFGSVMVVPKGDHMLAVKILKKSRSEFDNPHLFAVFTEVSILERCQGDRRVTQLKDYGCASKSYYIIMEYYPTTMKAWRRNNTPSINTLLRLYKEFLQACTVLVEKQINHFDIKCDNVMLDINGYPCLADFGEAMSYSNEYNCYTMLNKGTEWIKSPEMLSIALNSTNTNPDFDRRKKIGAGPASDVWSIGCLFYELITCEYLFAETNWSHFFRRITEKDQELILEANKLKLPKDPRFCNFLEFVLQRNVRSRPNINQVIAKFNEMFPEAGQSPLPTIEMPKFT